jgi:hypothetical protein
MHNLGQFAFQSGIAYYHATLDLARQREYSRIGQGKPASRLIKDTFLFPSSNLDAIGCSEKNGVGLMFQC